MAPDTSHYQAYALLAETLSARQQDPQAVVAQLKAQHIETPSWGYGNSGTRFKTFAYPGAARNVYEKIADAAVVHRITGVAPSVALHIPWDKVADYAALRNYAETEGVSIGAINPNVFQDEDYKLGALTNLEARIRQKAQEALLTCVEVMAQTGSSLLSLWFADGTNYAGQDDIRTRFQRMYEGLKPVYQALPEQARMLVEYKFFEPAFYHTDLPDWGTALLMSHKLGPKAQVLVDTGHHPQATNIAHIVALLLGEGRLGGFHFNDRKYADDDLMVGSLHPFELFTIYCELVSAQQSADETLKAHAARVAFMIDQSHNIESKVEAMVQSVVNCQVAYAKALIVDRVALTERQQVGDVLGAHRVLTDAFESDVRPLLRQARLELGLHPDPITALKESGYEARIAQERGQVDASGGYPAEA